jgi:hypothetical protein
MIMKSKLIKDVLLGVTTVCALAGFTPTASAAAPTGTCGLVASIPHPEFDWYAYGVSGGPTITKNMDLLAEINFTAKTIYYSVTQFTWTTGAPGSFSKATVAGNTTFTIAGPGVNTTNTTPNSYQISFTTGSSGTVTLNVLPVNSGNTFLIQGIGDRISGVCQAF